LITTDNELKRIARWFGWAVIEFLRKGINDANVNPIAVAEYLNDTKFRMPQPCPKRTKAQRCYPDVAVLDMAKLEPCIIGAVKTAGRELIAFLDTCQRHHAGSGIERVVRTTCEIIELFCVIRRIPRRDLEPYIRACRPWEHLTRAS
jgi:hypothetical protein